MTTTTIAIGTRTALSGAAAALNSLASANYVALGVLAFNNAGKTPLDAKIELAVTVGTVAAPTQVSLFAQESLDGTVFGSGPTAGTAAADEPNLRLIGTVSCVTSGQQHRAVFTLASRFGGMLPHSARIIAKNETGAALASTGNECFYIFGNGDTV